MENNTQLLEAFLSKPTTYTVDVLDNTMLPNGIKSKKQLKFTIKRPTLKVLALTALPLSKIPKNILEQHNVSIPELAPYFREVAEVVAIMAHGANSKPMPKWYADFFLANLTDEELFNLFKDVAMKSNSGFFLSCIHTARATNPMILEDSTPTN